MYQHYSVIPSYSAKLLSPTTKKLHAKHVNAMQRVKQIGLLADSLLRQCVLKGKQSCG